MKDYKVVIGGIEHTVQYSDDEAKERGLAAEPAEKAKAPANKARTPENKAG